MDEFHNSSIIVDGFGSRKFELAKLEINALLYQIKQISNFTMEDNMEENYGKNDKVEGYI